MVLGGVPERGEVLQQVGAEGPDGRAHPLHQIGEHIEHAQLRVALLYLLQQVEELPEGGGEEGLKFFGTELKVIDHHFQSLG